MNIKGTSNNFQFVTPAQAGVQLCQELMDSCFRRNDIFRGSLKVQTPKFGEKWLTLVGLNKSGKLG